MKGIMFTDEHVPMVMDGRKRMTRRLMKPQPQLGENGFWTLGGAGWSNGIEKIYPVQGHSLYNRMRYKPGDIVYVKEPWWCNRDNWRDADVFLYRIGKDFEPPVSPKESFRWRSKMYMPEDAARTFIKIDDVRAERLNDITEEDAIAEGIEPKDPFHVVSAVYRYAQVWNDINGKGAWNQNPWVWVYTFHKYNWEFANPKLFEMEAVQ